MINIIIYINFILSNIIKMNHNCGNETLVSSNVKKVKHYSYCLNDFIGKGNFSQVYRGVN